jgi:hypothetical protein
MFASRSLIEHLFRAALGIGALIASWLLASSSPIISLGLIAVALTAFRGCPTCWTVGLAQTAMATLGWRRKPRRCADGSCAAGSER